MKVQMYDIFSHKNKNRFNYLIHVLFTLLNQREVVGVIKAKIISRKINLLILKKYSATFLTVISIKEVYEHILYLY